MSLMVVLSNLPTTTTTTPITTATIPTNDYNQGFMWENIFASQSNTFGQKSAC